MEMSLLERVGARRMPVFRVLLAILCGVGSLGLCQVSTGEPIWAYDLKCEGMKNPTGVDSPVPGLSWKLASDEKGKTQTAWQIQAAASPEGLEEGACLWDSGKVTSSQQLNVPYGGPASKSSKLIYWRVRAWDESDEVGPWSKVVSWTMGIVDGNDWKADWITHPDQLKFDRQFLGYRSATALSENTTKWIQLDLGKPYPVDEVVIRAVRHTVAERLGFPMEFILEASSQPDFEKSETLMDCRGNPTNQWFGNHRVAGQGVIARYIRLTVPVLRNLDGEICLALSQMEVISGGQNIAPMAEATASDSTESATWSLEALTDGKGVPGYNQEANKTILLRKFFTIRDDPRRAVAHVTGLGHFVLRINGQRVGTNKLSPGWTSTDKTVFYDSHEVTDLVHQGDNVIEIELAGGMYSVPDPTDRYTKFIGRFRPLRALFQMELEHPDGTFDRIVSDASWKARTGPVTYSHMYGGEEYDLSQRSPLGKEFTTTGNGWVDSTLIPDSIGVLKGASAAAPPVTVIDELSPIGRTRIAKGVEVYDIGQNVSIIPRIKVTGESGARIRIIPAELLKPDGRVDRGSCGGGRLAMWELILDGQENPVSWEPEFFYHGARYLQVELIPAEDGEPYPKVLDLKGLVTHSTSSPVGEFSCSSPLFNETRELIRWAQRSNMVSVLTDCPHRERLGWLEQYHLNGPSLRYEFDLDRLFGKTFQDMEDAQVESGLIPNIAPEYVVFESAFRDSPEWGSAIILAAWQQYVFSGDRLVLDKYYKSMERYMDYLKEMADDDNLLYHGLGDWYDLGPERPGFAQLTPPGVTASATYFECALTMARIAGLLGEEHDALAYRELSQRIRESFNGTFLDQEAGFYGTGSQTANAMPLYLGLVPDEYREKVLETLIASIRANGNALTSGDIGHAYLLRALAKENRSDVIYDMHHQADRPGYGYILKNGATSLTESWDANRYSSQNHFMLGHIIEWFYHDLLGIQPDEKEPGFRHVIIRPQPCGEVHWARGHHYSAYGKIAVDWKQGAESFRLSVEVPVNTRATIHIPAGEQDRLYLLTGDAVKELPLHVNNGYAVVETGSGEYCYEVRDTK